MSEFLLADEIEPKKNGVINGDNSKQTAYEKLLEYLRFDQKVQWEMTYGKRIGFYTMKGELGCGNFSRVKAGVHNLTKGINVNDHTLLLIVK